MKDRVKELYLLLLSKANPYHVVDVEESTQKACIAKKDYVNSNHDSFVVGEDVYGVFKIQKIMLQKNDNQNVFWPETGNKVIYLFPNIKQLRDFPWIWTQE